MGSDDKLLGMKVHGSIIRLPLFGIFDRNLQPLIPRTPDGADPVTRHQMTLVFSKNNDFTGFDFRLTRRQFFLITSRWRKTSASSRFGFTAWV